MRVYPVAPCPTFIFLFLSSLLCFPSACRANREVFTLYELARVFSASLSLDETLSLFVKKIAELVPLDTCVVYLLDENQNVAIRNHDRRKDSYFQLWLQTS